MVQPAPNFAFDKQKIADYYGLRYSYYDVLLHDYGERMCSKSIQLKGIVMGFIIFLGAILLCLDGSLIRMGGKK